MITGKVDHSDPNIQKYIQDLSAKGQAYWDTMYKAGENREFLWDMVWNGVVHTDGGWPAKLQFRFLRPMVEAFVTEGTSIYMDPEVGRAIVDALEFITGTGEYPNGSWHYDGIYPETGNWWDWQIGAAQYFCDILMMMEKYLDDEEIIRYTDIINCYNHDPNCQISVGGSWGGTDSANLTDCSINILGMGILRKGRMNDPDEEKYEKLMYRLRAPECMPKAMGIKDGYASFGEGRYQDGSYICHGRYGYNGGYGADALKGVAFISNVLTGTSFDFPAEVIESFYDFALEAYLPLLYDGKMMTIVNGRGISRYTPGGQEAAIGCNTMGRMLLLAQNAPESFRNTVQSVVKYNLQIQIKIQKELRHGNYNMINSGHTSEEYYRWYLTMGVNHGTGTVTDGEYLYVTLPGMSVDQIKTYAAGNTLEIVEKGADVHMIRNHDLTAINYWGNETYTAGWLTAS